MFLHLIHFDPKFPPLIARVFETAMPGQNIFVLVGSKDGKTECLPGFHWVSTASELREVLAGHPTLSGVILNGLLASACDLLPVLPADLPVGWVPWGHEYYTEIPGSNWDLIGPMTRTISGWKRSHEIKSRILQWVHGSSEKNSKLDDLLARISTIATCSSSEFDLVCGNFPTLANASRIDVPVMHLEDLVDTGAEVIFSGHTAVQIGNSAFVTNNHLEAFYAVSRDLPNCRKVVVPLSYGDALYREAIIQRGTKMFGPAFEPLVEFLPLEQYNALVSKCSLVVLNSYRQQGIGNVINALWRGARVYLAAKNLCSELRSWGLSVWQFDKNTSLQLPDAAEVAENSSRNRIVLKRRMSQSSVNPKVREWLEGMARAL